MWIQGCFVILERLSFKMLGQVIRENATVAWADRGPAQEARQDKARQGKEDLFV